MLSWGGFDAVVSHFGRFIAKCFGPQSSSKWDVAGRRLWRITVYLLFINIQWKHLEITTCFLEILQLLLVFCKELSCACSKWLCTGRLTFPLKNIHRLTEFIWLWVICLDKLLSWCDVCGAFTESINCSGIFFADKCSFLLIRNNRSSMIYRIQ